MNYFDHESAAKRYAQARPYFQPQVITLVRNVLSVESPFKRALDVACGTGHSTQALLDIAEQIVGTDLSNAMLAHVVENPRITFEQAAAESLPFEENTFDLLSVCMAYHWFNQEAFMREAKRVLNDRGVLVVYNCIFPGIMESNSDYAQANEQLYANYPAPKRSEKHPTDSLANTFGFEGTQREFEFWVEWDVEALCRYLCTQSGIIQQVEAGPKTLDQVEADLRQRVSPYFSSETEMFLFQGDVSIWQQAQ